MFCCSDDCSVFVIVIVAMVTTIASGVNDKMTRLHVVVVVVMVLMLMVVVIIGNS